jgi:hypothetical protein
VKLCDGREKSMAITVYIDNNVWDFLFDINLNLSVELSKDEFCLCITREGEFEIPPMKEKNLNRRNSSRRR